MSCSCISPQVKIWEWEHTTPTGYSCYQNGLYSLSRPSIIAFSEDYYGFVPREEGKEMLGASVVVTSRRVEFMRRGH